MRARIARARAFCSSVKTEFFWTLPHPFLKISDYWEILSESFLKISVFFTTFSYIFLHLSELFILVPNLQNSYFYYRLSTYSFYLEKKSLSALPKNRVHGISTLKTPAHYHYEEQSSSHFRYFPYAFLHKLSVLNSKNTESVHFSLNIYHIHLVIQNKVLNCEQKQNRILQTIKNINSMSHRRRWCTSIRKKQQTEVYFFLSRKRWGGRSYSLPCKLSKRADFHL